MTGPGQDEEYGGYYEDDLYTPAPALTIGRRTLLLPPSGAMSRVLCLCEGGNVRSVALAAELKALGKDAIAAGLRRNSANTIALLIDWADTVVLMSEDLLPRWTPFHASAKAAGKGVMIVEVGPDLYGRANHPDLKAVVKPTVREWHVHHWTLR